MKKVITNFFIIFLTIILTSCTGKTVYLTPEVTGFVYDDETKQPFKNRTGIIVFNGFLDDQPTKITLKDNGRFILPAKTKKYYLSSPNKTASDIPPEIFFYFENYQSKTINYSSFYIKQVKKENLGYLNHNKINIGIVYLNPEN